jgi:hypothetical protein
MERLAWLAICVCAVLVGCDGGPDTRTIEEIWDPLVTRDFVAEGCANEVPFSYEARTDQESRVYRTVFDLKTDDAGLFCHLIVTIGPGGTLLPTEDYEKALKEAERMDRERSDSDSNLVESFFPEICRRAQIGFILSPNGGGGSTTFTTNDGRFDVCVEQGNHLSDKVTDPGVNTTALARVLSDRYDQQAR